MAKDTPRIYYDVTQLVHLKGNMTGIPRVMHELAVRFRKSNPNVAFVAWVKELHAMCELDLDKTLTHRGEGIEYLHIGQEAVAAAPIDPSPVALASKKGSVKRVAVKVARRGLTQVARIDDRLAQRLESRARQTRMSRYKRAEFKKGDIFF